MAFEQFIALGKSFSSAADGFEEWLRAWFNDLALQTLADIKMSSDPKFPVDTGMLRNTMSIRRIVREGNDLIAEYELPMEYASFVEYGHRIVNRAGATVGWKDGVFMVKIGLNRAVEDARNTFGNEFEAYLRSKGAA